MWRLIFLCVLFTAFGFNSDAQVKPFHWENDLLVINDGTSQQFFVWREGTLTLKYARSLLSRQTDTFPKASPDVNFNGMPVSTSQKMYEVKATERTAAYHQMDLYAKYKDHELRRSMRVYDETPGIEWQLSFRGKNIPYESGEVGNTNLVENPGLLKEDVPYYYFLPFTDPHFTNKSIRFKEATDHHSNLIHEYEELPYKKQQYYKGSVLLSQNNHTHQVHLIVKMAPLQEAQSAYSGYDFSTSFEGAKVHSPGFSTGYIPPHDGWKKAYPLFVLMYAPDEHNALYHYKQYELAIHKYIPRLDNTLTINTWGDRNRDSRINETFILNELEAASKLGITHYQIDDGWQQGLSQNSARQSQLLWDDWGAADWEVNKARFPGGLNKVIEKATSLNISTGLWFNPSKKDNYKNWQRDRDILIELYKKYNITWIKIDGVQIGNKLAETRLNNLLAEAAASSNGNLQFNMDVTAGSRGGFFTLNHLGNIFLENRYTDWGNYYPHLTLRNIWQLAKYIPVQRIQVEWLNKWRNLNSYPQADPLQPSRVPFDYIFAITMMGQPLAWMEATGLPDEAFKIKPLIDIYKKERSIMQKGIVSPVGNEPNGFRFPGFTSLTKNRLYVLLFRENTTLSTGEFTLPVKNISKSGFIKLGGNGKLMNTEKDKIEISFEKPFQFLWGYFDLNE